MAGSLKVWDEGSERWVDLGAVTEARLDSPTEEREQSVPFVSSAEFEIPLTPEETAALWRVWCRLVFPFWMWN